jgi:serine/threonine protein kinase
VSVQAGQKLLHYRLVEKIGEGGMGVVWKALDTTLDREVAIKILPETFSHRSERIDRFEREAKILASLSHPNIASIFGLHPATSSGEAVSFLAMELVEGEDLAQRLERGPVLVREALEIAAQVAEALEAAHERGVIHRDLKPANIRIDPEDRARVLDFGLAKAFGPETVSGDPEASPTLTSGGTLAGVILGTAAYMSPEQARGKAVDRRTDIWAFGCVLYEMLTGRNAFDGQTISDTVAAILKSEPDWSVLPTETPASVRRLLRRCLEKHPRERQHDIADARIAIREALDRPEGELDEPTVPARRAAVLPFAVGIVLGAVAAALTTWSLLPSKPPDDRPVRKFQFTVGDARPQPAISPDGSRIVYVDSGHLRIRDLGQLESRELPGTEGALFPFWSPDSTWVGFSRGKELWKISVTGGPPMRICEMEGPLSALGGGAAWGEGGRIVFTTGSSGLLEVSAHGGRPSSLLEPEAGEHDFHQVSALPDGRGFIFVVHGEQDDYGMAVLTAEGRKDLLVESPEGLWSPSVSSTGHVLYAVDYKGSLWALPYSLSSMEATGDPFPLGFEAHSASVASDATLVFVTSNTGRTRLVWVDPDRETKEVIGEPLPAIWPALDTNGRRIAVSVGGESADIWTHDLVDGSRRRVTFDDGPNFHPGWSPDGNRIAYSFFKAGTQSSVIKIKDADGTETTTSAEGLFPAFTPDGGTLVFSHVSDAGSFDLWKLELRAGAEPEPLLETEAKEYWPRVSPDGRYLAYQSDESGTWQIYVMPYPGGGRPVQVSVGGGQCPRWSADGKKLYFTWGYDLMEVELTAGDFTGYGTPRTLFSHEGVGLNVFADFTAGYDLLGNGERFLMIERAGTDGSGTRITVVENWDREFED